MSHTNKRYVVYDSYWFNHGYYHHESFLWENNVIWHRHVYTKKQLINQLAFWVNKKIKIVTDINLVTPADTYYNKVKVNPSRPGVKEWDIVRLTLICVKVIKDGEEKTINLNGLWKEAKKVHERISTNCCKHRSWENWTPPPVNWKKKRKCRHQYEVHFNPHKDTIKLSSNSIEDICLGRLIGKTVV